MTAQPLNPMSGPQMSLSEYATTITDRLLYLQDFNTRLRLALDKGRHDPPEILRDDIGRDICAECSAPVSADVHRTSNAVARELAEARQAERAAKRKAAS